MYVAALSKVQDKFAESLVAFQFVSNNIQQTDEEIMIGKVSFLY